MQSKVRNRVIDGIILNSRWLIDRAWAQEWIARYEIELQHVIATGITNRHSEERKARRTTVFALEDIDPTVKTVERISIRDGNFSPGSIAHIMVDGPMLYGDGMSHEGLVNLIEDFEIINNDSAIEGTLVQYNTGGGEREAGELMYDLTRSSTKPVLSYGTNILSAGYMGAIGGDAIIASSPMSVIGSIGVMAMIDKDEIRDFTENVDALYSRKSPNKNRLLNTYVAGDKEPYIDFLTEIDEHFMGLVKTRRTLSGETSTINNTLSGEVFLAGEAKKRGLIDGIGGMRFALNELARLINNGVAERKDKPRKNKRFY